MKYSLLIWFAGILFCACQKEDDLQNEIDFSNVYAITDDPSNPIQHERYLLYKEYGVSIYFNDTIGKQFIRNDIYGNPFYRYETIDPNWVFFNDSDQQLSGTFRFFYVEGEERQMKCLTSLRSFLENLTPKMRPTMIMVADSIWVVNSSGDINANMGGTNSNMNDFRANFRAILITKLADYDKVQTEEMFLSIERSLIMDKIYNYADELNEFGTVVDQSSYGRSGVFVYPNEDPYGNGGFYLYYARPETMFMADYEEFVLGKGYPESFIEDSRLAYAAIVGPWGFVAPRDMSIYRDATPSTVDSDISMYLQLILSYSPEEFKKYWGSYPLVMKKYNILVDIIQEKMGVEL